jgi:hypothetical protein
MDRVDYRDQGANEFAMDLAEYLDGLGDKWPMGARMPGEVSREIDERLGILKGRKNPWDYFIVTLAVVLPRIYAHCEEAREEFSPL